jgi:hypothetical protein
MCCHSFYFGDLLMDPVVIGVLSILGLMLVVELILRRLI